MILSIIIPVYNEEKTVISVLEKIKKNSSNLLKYEVIVIADGSTDQSKKLLENAQNKLDSASTESKKILDEAKKDGENLIIQMNDKFHKSSEIKKNITETKISQMKEAAIKEIKDTSI